MVFFEKVNNGSEPAFLTISNQITKITPPDNFHSFFFFSARKEEERREQEE